MFNGHQIFKLVDTYGLPLDIINLILRERNEHFNVAQFVESAVKANWTKERITWMLNINDQYYKDLIEKYYNYFHNQQKI